MANISSNDDSLSSAPTFTNQDGDDYITDQEGSPQQEPFASISKEGAADNNNHTPDKLESVRVREPLKKIVLWTNITVLLVLLVTTILCKDHLRLFTYNATKRTIKINKGISDQIHTALSTYGTAAFNDEHKTGWPANMTHVNLDMWRYENKYYNMLQSIVMDKAFCYPVIYDTTGRWKASDVSPACNCLVNSMVQYRSGMEAFLQKNRSATGDFTLTERFQAEITNLKTKYADYVRDTCLARSRGTVVEDFNPGSGVSVSTVFLMVMWNTVAGVVSYFRVLPKQNTDALKNNWTMGALLGLYFVVILAIHIPLFVTAILLAVLTKTNWTYWVGVVFTAVYSLALVLGWQARSRFLDKTYWPFRENVVFWSGLVISLVSMTLCNNSLVQARDEAYNWAMVLLAVLVTLMGYRGDYAQLDYEEEIVETPQKPQQDKAAAPAAKTKEDYARKRAYMFNWLATVAILYFAFGSTHVRAPVENFSNASRVATFCLQLMLTIPFLQVGGLGTRYEKISYNVERHPIFTLRIILELAARLIFTVALTTDMLVASQVYDLIEVKGIN